MAQPAAVAVTAIVIASAKYDISAAVNHDAAGMEGMEWLIGNALGWGIPAVLLPLVYWNRLTPSVKASIFTMAVVLFLSVSLVTFFWGNR